MLEGFAQEMLIFQLLRHIFICMFFCCILCIYLHTVQDCVKRCYEVYPYLLISGFECTK